MVSDDAKFDPAHIKMKLDVGVGQILGQAKVLIDHAIQCAENGNTVGAMSVMAGVHVLLGTSDTDEASIFGASKQGKIVIGCMTHLWKCYALETVMTVARSLKETGEPPDALVQVTQVVNEVLHKTMGMVTETVQGDIEQGLREGWLGNG